MSISSGGTLRYPATFAVSQSASSSSPKRKRSSESRSSETLATVAAAHHAITACRPCPAERDLAMHETAHRASKRAPPASAAIAISGRPATMPIAKATTNVAKARGVRCGAESPSRPHRRAPLPEQRPGKEIRRCQGRHDGRRVVRTLSRLGEAASDAGDSSQFRIADPGPPEPQEGFALAGQQPAQRGHQGRRLTPGVGRGDHLDASSARGSQQPATSIAAEYHMLRQAISEMTLRFRKASGCALSSDRMGSEGDRYHTW